MPALRDKSVNHTALFSIEICDSPSRPEPIKWENIRRSISSNASASSHQPISPQYSTKSSWSNAPASSFPPAIAFVSCECMQSDFCNFHFYEKRTIFAERRNYSNFQRFSGSHRLSFVRKLKIKWTGIRKKNPETEKVCLTFFRLVRLDEFSVEIGWKATSILRVVHFADFSRAKSKN